MDHEACLALHRKNQPVMFRSIYWATVSLPSFQAWEYDSARYMVFAIRLARHEAYGFHSTAIIDDGCLRY